jgi:hypothetical protein
MAKREPPAKNTDPAAKPAESTAKPAESTAKKPAKRKAATTKSPRMDGADRVGPQASKSDEPADAVLASTGHTAGDDRRRQLIAIQAYFLAERRGFAAGQEVEDWIAAEVVVDLLDPAANSLDR